MTRIYVQYSDCGNHIRKWSREPFEGGVAYDPAPVWQPIETAPKDGTSILVLAEGFDARMGVVAFDDDWGRWWMCDDGKQAYELPLRGPDPTAWMPLPAGPEEV